MKISPILYSAAMVNAQLEGRKTQTRRILKPQPGQNLDDGGWYPGIENDGISLHYANEEHFKKGIVKDFSPYQAGDLLWVKESWGYYNSPGIYGGKFTAPSKREGKEGWPESVTHKAGKENCAWGMYGEPKWRSGRFMFKTSSRLINKIVNVRVERLQDITYANCESEGIVRKKAPWVNGSGMELYYKFMSLWESINGPGSWEFNPWVWVIEFEVIHKNIIQYLKENSTENVLNSAIGK